MNEFLKCAIDLWIIDFLEKNSPSTGHEIWTAMGTAMEMVMETGMATGMVMATATATERLEKEGIIEGSGSNYWWNTIFSLKNNKFFQQSEDEMVISDLLQSNGNEKFESDIAAKVLLLIKESKNVSS